MMQFVITSSPHILPSNSTTVVMRRVLLALLPGIAVLFWLFGWGIFNNLALASATALVSEALILLLRRRPVLLTLSDGSALLTAWLLAVALPPLAPWWMVVLGTGIAVVFAKQLYGGLGYNPFNPAMIGYVSLLACFPLEMSSWSAAWSPAELTLGQTLAWSFDGSLPANLQLDALTGATALDHMRTGIGTGKNLEQLYEHSKSFGWLGTYGWEWVSLAFALGGIWLCRVRAADWRIPAAMLGSIALLALVFHLYDAQRYASPLVHLFSGASMLGAFFIATDPVTACTTPRGRWIYGAGIGLLVYIIRNFGGYPDGVAFAVLLMNLVAPSIDALTIPRPVGARR